MLDFSESKYKVIVIGLIIFLVLSLFNLIGTDRDYNFVEGVFIDLLSPVFAVTNNVQNMFIDVRSVIFEMQEVKQENQKLREQVATLQYNQNKLESVMAQNERLKDLLNFKEETEHQILGAKVIGHNTGNWSSTVLINQGRNAGVEQGMPVISNEGYLAGIVQRTSRNNNQTILINDMNFVTSALVADSREVGTVKGQIHDDQLLMDNLEWDAEIEVGDIIVTSGLSRNYPKDIPIGRVTSVFADDYGLSQAAYIRPFADLRSLEEVLVVIDYDSETEADDLLDDDSELDNIEELEQ